MRLGLSLCLVGTLAPLGCFDEPPSSSSGNGTTTTADPTSTGRDASPATETASASTGDEGSTSVAATTNLGTTGDSTTEDSTTEDSTTTGPPAGILPLYPLTCTAATWRVDGVSIPCSPAAPGPFVDAHDNYTLGGQSFPRVIETRPPNVPDAPLDGLYVIDTSGFETPQFQTLVACATNEMCEINFDITSERDGRVLSNWGGNVTDDGDPVEVLLNLPSESGLVIHVNISSPGVIGDSRFFLIDPRVVEGGP